MVDEFFVIYLHFVERNRVSWRLRHFTKVSDTQEAAQLGCDSTPHILLYLLPVFSPKIPSNGNPFCLEQETL
jgi:hypothetical protein